MKLTATLYTGMEARLNHGKYLFVYRRRIYEDGTEIIDSIETSLLDDEIVSLNYKSDDIIENMNRDTYVIKEQIWQEYCDELAKYLTENNIIN